MYKHFIPLRVKTIKYLHKIAFHQVQIIEIT